MHTPTKTQWNIVIENFKKVFHLATLENHLNMSETLVNEAGYQCGTIHCMGGWYAVATLDLFNRVSYRRGAIQMAQDLGFNDDNTLEDWARENPDIWGNAHGFGIFSNERAYNGASTLQEAVTYLEGVRDRSPD